MIGVEADLVNVEGLGSIDVRDRHEDELDPHVHVHGALDRVLSRRAGDREPAGMAPTGSFKDSGGQETAKDTSLTMTSAGTSTMTNGIASEMVQVGFAAAKASQFGYVNGP